MVCIRDVIPVLLLWQPVSKFFLPVSSRKLHKSYQMSDKINSHVCLINVECLQTLSTKEAIYYGKLRTCACHPLLWSRKRQLYRFSGYFRLHAVIYTVATTKLESSRIILECLTFSP